MKNCFPRDWSMTGLLTVSDVFDGYGDRANFLFGFVFCLSLMVFCLWL